MAAAIGWDVGGAHLKGVRLEGGSIAKAVQVACPLWLGLEHLDKAIGIARETVGDAGHQAVTMTGELADVFPDRAAGVESLARRIAEALAPAQVRIYGGGKGFVAPAEAGRHVNDIASANWHASAAFIARHEAAALFADMGSTTTDLIPIAGGAVASEGTTDLGRLAAGELVYTGLTRSFLMSICERVPFKGRWLPLMNEYFANMADVYRVLGELGAEDDQHATADGRDKSKASSIARLARMVGCDAAMASEHEWRALARWFAERQLRTIEEAARLVLSRRVLREGSPLVGAGAGRIVMERLAQRLALPYRAFENYFEASPEARPWLSTCAPAAAVAVLAA